MGKSYEEKYDQFLEGWTGKTKKERDADDKARKNRFSGIKKFFGMKTDEPKKKPKMRKSPYVK